MNDLPSSIANLIEAYKLAVLEQNLSAFMDLYDPHVRVFDAWGVWSYQGADAWRKMVHAWFSSLGNERVKVTFEDLQIITSQELSTVTSIVTYASVTPEGKELRAMQNRLTWTLKLENGAWKIIHEHTSAPVGFEDQKAILQRQNPK